MAWRFNPLTINLDIVGSGSGTSFNENLILTGPSNSLQFEDDEINLDVLTDQFGNVLLGV